MNTQKFEGSVDKFGVVYQAEVNAGDDSFMSVKSSASVFGADVTSVEVKDFSEAKTSEAENKMASKSAQEKFSKQLLG